MNPANWLTETAQRSPDAPALMRGTEHVADYAAFAARTASLAGKLAGEFKITPGDRVAIFMGNSTRYLEMLYASWFAGACVVPINSKLHPREAAWIIEHSESTVICTVSKEWAKLNGLAPACVENVLLTDSPEFEEAYLHEQLPAPVSREGSDMLWLFYTSGTTGKPKGVMLTADNLAAMTEAYYVDVDEVSPGDAFLYAAPMSHGAGLYNFMGVQKGCRHVVPASGGFDAGEILSLAPQLGNVSMFAAPTMIKLLVEKAKASGVKGEGLKTIVYGGGPMYVADIVEAVEVMGPRFVQIYGQGESPMTITALQRDLVADRSHSRWKERLGSVGRAHSCVEVKIAGEGGEELPRGEIGEILVKGETVMAGYWRNPEATAETLQNGWLWTGDTGAMDEDGFVTLHDRSKDVIISGGTNIYPREVEEVLLTHASVKEAAVVGRVHPEWGEEVVAFIVTGHDAPFDEDALDRHCLDHIARFKRPRHYVQAETLPKNNYGKVLKTELRERLAD